MENLWRKDNEEGFTVLPLLCGITVIGWLSGCVFLLGNNERKLAEYLTAKMETKLFCEQILMNTSRLIDSQVISLTEIEQAGKEPIYTDCESEMTYNVYAVKENSDIILLGEGRRKEVFIRIYLHLIWQEDSKKWIPLYYET